MPAPAGLGVDDWAIHKGLTYGTILVALKRHRPVDPGRRTEEQRASLPLLRAEDAAIAVAVDLAEDCLVMLRRREGERAPDGLAAAEARGVDELQRFAGKRRADQGAPSRPG